MAKRVAVMTSGGDAPGMNAALRAVVRAGLAAGYEMFGIYDGYRGLYAGHDRGVKVFGTHDISGILMHGGTALRSAREPRMRTAEGRAVAAAKLKSLEIDQLVVIGGDGTFMGAQLLAQEHGISVVGIPATIDNNLRYTEWSIGFDSALACALRGLRETAVTMNSHLRLCFVEIMGDSCGDLALHAGLAVGAEAILLPEHPFDFERHTQPLTDHLLNRERRQRSGGIVVVSEGATGKRDTGICVRIYQAVRDSVKARAQAAQAAGDEENAQWIQEVYDGMRASSLGHTLRGTSPSAPDVILASRLGVFAVAQLAALSPKDAIVVGIRGSQPFAMDLIQAVGMQGESKFDEDLYQMAHGLGYWLGKPPVD